MATPIRKQARTLYGKRPPAPQPSRGTRIRGAARDTARRAATSAGRSTGRAAARTGGRVAGNVGTFLVLVIGMGVVVAVIRNPKLVTVPLRLLTGVTTGVAGLSKVGASAANVSVPGVNQ